MQFIKGLFRHLAGLGFKLSLILLAVVGSVTLLISSPGQLKQSLHSSKVYDAAATQIVDQAAKSGGDKGSDKGTDKVQPELLQAAKAAITPTFIQSTSEQIIDSLFNWLSGKTPQPQFSIDATSVKQQFIQAAGDAAVARAKQLPVCTLQQTRQLNTNDIDPFNVPCVPRGYDINGLRAQVASQIDGSSKDNQGNKDNPLKNPIITPDNLPKDEQGKTLVQNLTEKASNAPKIFQWVKRSPFIFAASGLVFAGLVLLLSDDKRRGLRSLAITSLVVGILVSLSVVVTNYLGNKLQRPDGPILKNLDSVWSGPVLSLVHTLSNSVNHRLLLYGTVYGVLGVGTLLALHFTKPKTKLPELPVVHEGNATMLPKPSAGTEPKLETEPKKPEAKKAKKIGA